jgi:hypothetical protein
VHACSIEQKHLVVDFEHPLLLLQAMNQQKELTLLTDAAVWMRPTDFSFIHPGIQLPKN